MPYLLPTSILGKNLDWIPFAGRLIWFSIILVLGLTLTYLAMKPARFELPMPKSRLIFLSFFAIAIVYFIGVFVEPLQVLCFWINLFIVFSTAALFCVTTTITKNATWAQTILGGIWTFFLMAIAYASIPHEWISFASGYLGMSADKLFIEGGKEFPNIFNNFPKHLLPFEVSFEVLQDIATMTLYVVLATINVKFFSNWQKREVVSKQSEDSATSKEEELKAKLSAFGRPVKKQEAN